MWMYRLTFFFALSFSFSTNILSAIPFLNDEKKNGQSPYIHHHQRKKEKGKEEKQRGKDPLTWT